MKILVAVDRSPVSELVVDLALKIAKCGLAPVLLVNVSPREPDVLGRQLTRKVITGDVPPELKDRRELLDSLAKRFAEAGIACETLMIRGDPGPTLLAEATRWEATMIIMGSHGRGALYRQVIGSVSEAVLKSRKFPVLVVPGKPGGISTAADS